MHSRYDIKGLYYFIVNVAFFCNIYYVIFVLFTAKVYELEKMLYSVLGKNAKHGSLDVCPLYANNTMNCKNLKDGDIRCTSIDLLANKSDCHVCVSNTWISFNPCKVHSVTEFPIVDEDKGIHIDIFINGTIAARITDDSTDFVSRCQNLSANCVPSKYTYDNYTGTSNLTSANKNNLLFCEQEKNPEFNDRYYCLKNDAGKEALCYDRQGRCTVNNQTLTCEIRKYNDSITSYFIINKDNCGNIKELSSDCTFDFSVNNININDKSKDDADVIINCNNETGFFCYNKRISVTSLCKKETSICKTKHSPNNDNKVTVDRTSSDNDESESKGSNYTWFLVIIIVILLLLLVSYYGYQNQWHHKVSALLITSNYLNVLIQYEG